MLVDVSGGSSVRLLVHGGKFRCCGGWGFLIGCGIWVVIGFLGGVLSVVVDCLPLAGGCCFEVYWGAHVGSCLAFVLTCVRRGQLGVRQ